MADPRLDGSRDQGATEMSMRLRQTVGVLLMGGLALAGCSGEDGASPGEAQSRIYSTVPGMINDGNRALAFANAAPVWDTPAKAMDGIARIGGGRAAEFAVPVTDASRSIQADGSEPGNDV